MEILLLLSGLFVAGSWAMPMSAPMPAIMPAVMPMTGGRGTGRGVAAYHDPDYDPEAQSLRIQLDSQEVRLLRMKARYERLRDSVPSDAQAERDIVGWNSDLDLTHGNDCEEDHFQCGGHRPQCMSHLVVCDGYKDCDNGHDEEHCVNPLTKGSRWIAHMNYDECTQRKPDTLTMDVERVTVPPFFKSRPQVTVRMSLHGVVGSSSYDTSFICKGYYNFGNNEVYIEPPEDDRLGIRCQFDGGDMNSCEGFMVREGTDARCAGFTFAKE